MSMVRCSLLGDHPHDITPSNFYIGYSDLSFHIRTNNDEKSFPINTVNAIILVSNGEICIIQSTLTDYILKGCGVAPAVEEGFVFFSQKNQDAHKFIRYHYEGESAMTIWDPKYDLCRCIRRCSSDHSLLPFPHTKLDFLNLHRNRSVMIRLSSNNDQKIELSCDQVSVSGYPYSCIFTGLGDAEILAQFKSTAIFEQVLILTEKTLYITKLTGVVQGAIPLDKCSMRFLRGKGFEEISNCIYVEHRMGTTVILSKFATDLVSRFHSRPKVCSSKPERSPQRKVSEKYVQVEPDDFCFEDHSFLRALRSDGRTTSAIMTLSARVEELEEALSIKDIIISKLQAQLCLNLPPSNDGCISNIVSQPMTNFTNSQLCRVNDGQSALLHYLCHIEREKKELKSDNVHDRIKLLERHFFDDLPTEQTALQHALLDAKRREGVLKTRLESSLERNKSMEVVTSRLLSELGERVNNSIDNFVANYKASEGEGQGVNIHHIKKIIRSAEDRATEEVNRKTKLLKSQLKKLQDELLYRDEAFDDLLKENSIRLNPVSTQTRLLQNLIGTNESISAEVSSQQRKISDLEATLQYLEDEIAQNLKKVCQTEPSATDILKAKNKTLSELSFLPKAIRTIVDLEELLFHQQQSNSPSQSEDHPPWKVGTVVLNPT